MKVLKFGGTSVGSVENLYKVKSIVEKQSDDVIVVVSALGGITDKILNAARMAAMKTGYFTNELIEITTRHKTVIQTIIQPDKYSEVEAKTLLLLNELNDLITGVSLIGELTDKTLDRIAGYGERISSVIISEFLQVPHYDSSLLITTDSNFGSAAVDFEATNKQIRATFANFSSACVVPGFISANSDGDFTTLGRGGSDYTAAIFAAALDAESLEIWTDVDGFMTADPRVISKAYVIPKLSYSEAMELSHFGAKVIYPPTIIPVFQKQIPVWIKNTINPEVEGSLISSDTKNAGDRVIKGISSISDISLMTVQGIGMVGVTGISKRLFTALAQKDINVILISQASSENSISIAISSKRADDALSAIKNEFDKEYRSGKINKITVETDLAIVAIVGENMRENAGIAGKLFSIVGTNGINIRAIAQGASELNISWVVKTSDLRKTLNVVHEGFFLSEYKELNLYLMGIGTVGGNLLKQLQLQNNKLLKENRLRIKLVGVANSKKMLFNRDGIDLVNYKEELLQSTIASSISGFRDMMLEMNVFNSVFVDCTAIDEVATIYNDVLNANISIVAANKVAASSEYSKYLQLKETARRKGIKFYFETNVGAGLPIISTINDLVKSGDKILKIEAVLSGTLNFIFNTISSQIPLSTAIKMAMEAGYAEPDPRIDLSGKDVVRKLLILVREAGYRIEESEVAIERFIPDSFFEGTIDNFWNEIKLYDSAFEVKRKVIEQSKRKWRFVASFNNSKATLSLVDVESNSPFYELEGSNNILLLTTERYNDYPMQIKGYGAGASVTAAGVFSDIIRIANI